MRAKSIPTIMAKSQPLAMVLALVVASGEAFMAPPAIPRACPSAPPAVGKASPAATRDVAKGGARSAVVAPLGASQLGSGYIVSALTDLLKGEAYFVSAVFFPYFSSEYSSSASSTGRMAWVSQAPLRFQNRRREGLRFLHPF